MSSPTGLRALCPVVAAFHSFQWAPASQASQSVSFVTSALHWEGSPSLAQPRQGSAHDGTKPVRVQGASGPCSWSYGLSLGSPVRSRELDLMMLMGPFQLERFCGSKCSRHAACSTATQLRNKSSCQTTTQLQRVLEKVCTSSAVELGTSSWTAATFWYLSFPMSREPSSFQS